MKRYARKISYSQEVVLLFDNIFFNFPLESRIDISETAT